MNQQQLAIAKFVSIGIVLVGGFALVAAGRLDAAVMYRETTTMVGALVVALGISGAGSAAVAAVGTATQARLAALRGPDELRRVTPSGRPGSPAGPLVALFVFLGMVGIARAAVGCGGTLSPGQATDISVGVNAAACVIDNAATDIAAGESPAQVVADLVAKCGVSVAQVATLLDHQAASLARLEHPQTAAKFAALAASARDGAARDGGS